MSLLLRVRPCPFLFLLPQFGGSFPALSAASVVPSVHVFLLFPFPLSLPLSHAFLLSTSLSFPFPFRPPPGLPEPLWVPWGVAPAVAVFHSSGATHAPFVVLVFAPAPSVLSLFVGSDGYVGRVGHGFVGHCVNIGGHSVPGFVSHQLGDTLQLREPSAFDLRQSSPCVCSPGASACLEVRCDRRIVGRTVAFSLARVHLRALRPDGIG